MSKNDGGPAFPGFPGTLRDYFAGQALTGLMACQDFMNELCRVTSGTREDVRAELAMFAYKQANAMLAEREKKCDD